MPRFLKFNFVKFNFCQNVPARYSSIHHPLWASILMRNIIWNVRQEKLRINTFTLQRTCVIVYETLMSQASAASGRGEGGARPSPHSKIFVFKSLQSWGGPLQNTAQIARSFSKFLRRFSHDSASVACLPRQGVARPSAAQQRHNKLANELSSS